MLTNCVLVWLTDPPNVNPIEYTATPGLKYLPEGNKPIDYFNILFTDELLDLLVEETNAYALEIFFKMSHQNARITNWIDTNKLEMKKFLSLVFHMGTIKLNRLEDYWKTNKLFIIPFFQENMNRNRFMLLF